MFVKLFKSKHQYDDERCNRNRCRNAVDNLCTYSKNYSDTPVRLACGFLKHQSDGIRPDDVRSTNRKPLQASIKE